MVRVSPDSLFKQPAFAEGYGGQANAPPPVFFAERPGYAVFFSSPSGHEGMARQVALPSSVKVSALPLRECGSASRRATRTGSLLLGLICGPSSSASPSVVNGISAPGRAFRFGAAQALPVVPAVRMATLWAAIDRQELIRQAFGKALPTTPSASSWQAAHIGHRAEPRRRPSAWEERSSPARGRRILLHHQTPHDDAPRLSRTNSDYISL